MDPRPFRSVGMAILIIGLLVNLTQIAMLILRGRKRNNSETILLSVCLGDIFFTTGSIVGYTLYLQANIYASMQASVVIAPTIWLSAIQVLFLTGDRLIAITNPLWYKAHVTKRKLSAVLVFFWAAFIFVVTMEASLLLKGSRENSEKHFKRHAYSAAVMVFAGVTLNSLAYTFIAWKVTSATKAWAKCGPINTRREQHDRKLVTMCFLISFSMFAFSLPVAIAIVLNWEKAVIFETLGTANPILNSLAYFFHSRLHCCSGLKSCWGKSQPAEDEAVK